MQAMNVVIHVQPTAIIQVLIAQNICSTHFWTILAHTHIQCNLHPISKPYWVQSTPNFSTIYTIYWVVLLYTNQRSLCRYSYGLYSACPIPYHHYTNTYSSKIIIALHVATYCHNTQHVKLLAFCMQTLIRAAKTHFKGYFLHLYSFLMQKSCNSFLVYFPPDISTVSYIHFIYILYPTIISITCV